MLEAAWLPGCLAAWLTCVPGSWFLDRWDCSCNRLACSCQKLIILRFQEAGYCHLEPSRTKPAQQEARRQLRGWGCTVSMSARNFKFVWKWWHQQQASSASTSACGNRSSWYKEAANL